MSGPEAAIQAEIRLVLGGERDVALWRNNVGLAEFWNERLRRMVRVEYGLAVGSADLVGIGPGGTFLALEVKTERGRTTPEQERWLELVRLKGGVGRVVRSAEEAVEVVRAMRARTGGV